MNELIVFFQQNGLWLTLIALAGIILLGILKYCNVFKKMEENYRHICYLAITVTLSLAGSIIYLACTKQISAEYIFTLAGAIFALNQAFYAIYSTTSLQDLIKKLGEWIKSLFEKREEVEEVVDQIKEELKINEDHKENK